MAVEAFLTPSEAKMTIEKKVKQKPSTNELTKIERPGKMEEQPEIIAKPKKAIKKPKAPSKIENPNRDTVLIVTEKPQAALKISSALGNARKYSENNVPYYELERNGKKIIVASAVGHLFNLTYAEGQKGWPIFKLDWIPSYESKTGGFTKSYYMLLKNSEEERKK